MRSAAFLLLLLALAAAALVAGVRLAGRADGARLEIGRVRPTQLSEATRERLRGLDSEVVLTWFSSAPDRVPARLRGLREEVARVLSALARASDGRLRWELVDPDASDDLAAYAAQCQVKPLRMRTVTRDAWSERGVWSTLSIAYGARPRAQIAGVTPDDVGLLQDWIVAQLDELERPRRPVIGLDAPDAGFERLAARLAPRAEVVRCDVARGALDERVDLLLWVAPREPTPEAARALLALLDDGVSAVIAGSPWRATPSPGADAIAFEPARADFAGFLAGLGLETPPGVVLDALCETERSGPHPGPRPWRVRSIAPNQDFRALEGQPNGTLLLEAPCAFLPSQRRLDELGLELIPLATAGPDAWVLAPPIEPLALEQIGPDTARSAAAPKATLAALLAPLEAQRGSLVLIGSASPLRDGELEREDTAHGVLLDLLVANLASPTRLVAARLSAPGAARIPALEPPERRLWRALCVGLPPAVALLLLLARRRRRLPWTFTRRVLRASMLVALAAVLLPVLVALARGLVHGRVDLTRGGLHQLAPQTLALAARIAGPLEAELVLSRELPPELADLPARLEDALRALGRGLPGPLELVRTAPEALSTSQLEALAARGATPFPARVRTADEARVRSVHATLLLRSGAREEVLRFPDRAAAEPLELRLALALGRLAGDPRARGRVIVAADTPRLSPAEAHLEYELAGRFAPTGADVYARARTVLERAGFEVVPHRPDAPAQLDPTDLLIWLQPRRSIEPMLRTLAAHLHAGGRALVAAQHYNVRSRQLAAEGFRTVHWPEPQFADLEQSWLAGLGVELVREVLCDSSQATLALPTEVERPGEGRDFVLQEATQPFQIRALAARFAAHSPLVAGLSDQLFLWGNRIALDRARLAARGLEAEVLMETTPAAWAVDWKGGYLDPNALAGPPASGPLGVKPLAVAVRGVFPALDPAETAAVREALPGELVLIGCSQLFQSAHLEREDFRGDQLLIDLVATLALGEDYGRIAARRPVAPGFDPPPPERRLAWRALVVLAWPAGLAAGALAWRWLRRGHRAVELRP